jgi:hypothetical protein
MSVDDRRRSNLVAGLLLILGGLLVLALQLLPNVVLTFTWPWIIIGFALVVFLIGAVTGVPALAVPACIIGGIGGILTYQTITGDWDSWAYVWAFIPGFVGLGLVVAGLLGGDGASSMRAGGWLILISLVLFAAFGSLFGALGLLGAYWPVLLIVLGLLLLLGPLLRPRR